MHASAYIFKIPHPALLYLLRLFDTNLVFLGGFCLRTLKTLFWFYESYQSLRISRNTPFLSSKGWKVCCYKMAAAVLKINCNLIHSEKHQNLNFPKRILPHSCTRICTLELNLDIYISAVLCPYNDTTFSFTFIVVKCCVCHKWLSPGKKRASVVESFSYCSDDKPVNRPAAREVNCSSAVW